MTTTNHKVYIHEFIDIVGHNRSRYMHHMTANWCPLAMAERNQRCFGVWGTVGSTGRWPEVVNMWELEGWDGMVANFTHEFSGGGMQDPSLAQWWATAASMRRGGIDRVVVPEPWTRSIDDLVAQGVRGEVYAHELVTLPIGTARLFLDAVRDVAVESHAELGIASIGAFRVAMVNDSECLLIWAIPDWSTWAQLEQAWLTAGDDGTGPLADWRQLAGELAADWRRTLLVDAPLSPMRIGRQPQISDRLPLDQLDFAGPVSFVPLGETGSLNGPGTST
ncbi:MAG: NIPSNAP family containing protein [Actinomycetes bacterium]